MCFDLKRWCAAMGGKGLPSADLLLSSDQQRLDGTIRAMPDFRGIGRIAGRMNRLSDRYIAALEVLVEDPKRDEIHALMLSTFNRAWAFGYELAGVPEWVMTDEETVSLISFVEEEIGFLADFIGLEAMSFKRRLRMYRSAVQAALIRGWVSVLPRAVVITWNLSVVEHCVDCLRLAFNSPYSKPGLGPNPLPTVPRAGGTRCLSNCRCFLRATTPDFDSSLNLPVGIEVFALGDVELDPTSDAARGAALLYADIVRRYGWNLRMGAAMGGAVAALHRARARLLRAQIDSLASQNGHRIRLSMSPALIVAPIQVALASGFRFIPLDELNNDLLTVLAAILLPREGAAHGVIQEISGTRVRVDDEWYDISEIGGNLLFVGD